RSAGTATCRRWVTVVGALPLRRRVLDAVADAEHRDHDQDDRQQRIQVVRATLTAHEKLPRPGPAPGVPGRYPVGKISNRRLGTPPRLDLEECFVVPAVLVT